MMGLPVRRFGSTGWGPQDDAESIATIHHAVDAGINWLDTAPEYGLGHSEEIVGRALAEMSETDRPLVFTKCAMVWDPEDGPIHSGLLSGTFVPSRLAPGGPEGTFGVGALSSARSRLPGRRRCATACRAATDRGCR
jgi:aryl-alcohol dehydrogenase-like predicted oxidoreductase